jgi:hypothetical protein
MSDHDTGRGPRPEPQDARPVLGSFVGMGGMAAVLFVILASGAIPPWWALVAITLVWLVLLVLGARWFMHHPWRVAALPVAVFVIWLAMLAAGVAYLDWRA